MVIIFSGALGFTDSLKYFGQSPPGDKPVIFAPEVISKKDRIEFCPTFTPDGKEVFFSIRQSREIWTILTLKRDDQGLRKAIKPLFLDGFSCLEPFISPDGKKLFFSSNRPLTAGGQAKDYDIWYVIKTNDKWSKPINAGPNINTTNSEWRATVSLKGNLYYSSFGLWKAKAHKIGYGKAQKISDINNPVIIGGHAFIAPDESYILTSWMQGPKAQGGWDLYITFRNTGEKWGKSKNMGNIINTKGDEDFPYVSPDGKYLFFFRRYIDNSNQEQGDIYWVDAKILNKQ